MRTPKCHVSFPLSSLRVRERISLISDVSVKFLPSVIFRSGICLKFVKKTELLAEDFGETVGQRASLSNKLLLLTGNCL